MGKTLAVFSFEGMLLRYPVSSDEVDEWIKSDHAVEYPYVPDIPGPDGWDKIAIEFLEKFKKSSSEILFLSNISGGGELAEKKITSLIKSLKVEEPTLFRNDGKIEDREYFWREIRYYLQKHQTLRDSFDRVELFLYSVELAKELAESIIENYNITSVVHDLNPSLS